MIPELTSLQCNWKGNQKGKGTDETPEDHCKYVFWLFETQFYCEYRFNSNPFLKNWLHTIGT